MIRYLIIAIALLALSAGPAGCTKRSEPAEPVKTEQEFQQEARQEITEENIDEELSNLEEEINSDTESEP